MIKIGSVGASECCQIIENFYSMALILMLCQYRYFHVNFTQAKSHDCYICWSNLSAGLIAIRGMVTRRYTFSYTWQLIIDQLLCMVPHLTFSLVRKAQGPETSVAAVILSLIASLCSLK